MTIGIELRNKWISLRLLFVFDRLFPIESNLKTTFKHSMMKVFLCCYGGLLLLYRFSTKVTLRTFTHSTKTFLHESFLFGLAGDILQQFLQHSQYIMYALFVFIVRMAIIQMAVEKASESKGSIIIMKVLQSCNNLTEPYRYTYSWYSAINPKDFSSSFMKSISTSPHVVIIISSSLLL